MQRWLAVWTRLLTVVLIVGAVALASLDTGTGQATSLAPQITAPTLALPPGATTSARASTTSAAPAAHPITFAVNLGYFAVDRDLMATVTVSGTSPGALHLDNAGLTFTSTATTSGGTVLTFSGTTTSVMTALATGRVGWLVPQQLGEVTLEATLRQALPANASFNPDNGHYYQRVETISTWDNASASAAASELFGLSGHLVTITSQAEQNFVGSLVSSNEWWIGASDSGNEGTWSWRTGPEAGHVFWQYAFLGGREGQQGFGADGFAWWGRSCGFLCGSDKPDEFLGVAGQDFAVMDANDGDTWNDVSDGSRRAIVEYGLADGNTADRAVVNLAPVTLTAITRLVDIIAYAEGTNTTAPNAAEWSQAMVTGVDTEAFAASLATVLASPSVSGTSVDTSASAQTLVASYRRVLDFASTNGASTPPTSADYDRLGLGTLSADLTNLMNGRVRSSGLSGVDTYEDLTARLVEAMAPPPPPAPPATNPTTTTTTTTTTTPTTTTTTSTTLPTTTTPATSPSTSPDTVAPSPSEPVAPEPVTPVVTPVAPITQQPDGAPLELSPGEALVLVGDRSATMTVTAANTSTLEVRGDGVNLRVSTRDVEGEPSLLDAQGNLTVPAGGSIEVSGEGFVSSDPVQIWLFSDPIQLGSATPSPTGALSARVVVPDSVTPDSHTLQLVGRDPAGDIRAVSLGLTVSEAQEADDEPDPTPTPDVTPGGGDEPAAPDEPEPVQPVQPAQPYAPFSALDEPEELVATAVTAVAVLAAASAAGAAAGAAGAAGRASAQGSAGGSSNAATDEVGYVEAVGSMHLEAQVEDHTALRWQWLSAWPGTRQLDGLTRTLMQWAAPRSPLLERLIGDGSTWRALFGSASLVLTGVGMATGVAAVIEVNGDALPPSLTIMTILMVVGALDAFAGAAGFATVLVGTLLSGGIDDASSVRTLLGLAAAIVGPGLVANAFRPLRRPPSRTAADWWERLSDLAVVPLMAGLVAQGIVWGLNGMAGVYLPITDFTNRLAVVVMGAVALRVIAEEVIARWFPARILAVTPDDYPEPSTLRQLLSVATSASVYVFVVIAFLGNVWQLWVAGALYAGPMVLGFLAERFPNSPALWRVLPQGVPFMVVLLWGGAQLAGWAEQWLGDSADFARTSFVVVAAFPAVLALMSLVGREPAEGEVRWNERPSLRHLYRLGGLVTVWMGIQISV